jgi:hypothetical protein
VARREGSAPDRPEIPAVRSRNPNVNRSRAGHSAAQPLTHDAILIELIEHPGPAAYREAPLVQVTWPAKATMCDLRRFPEMAAVAARLFATAAPELAAIKAKGSCEAGCGCSGPMARAAVGRTNTLHVRG